MEDLPPAYLSEIGRQIAFVSAFLGGFSATFLGTLFFAKSERKLASWTVASAASAASSFIVAVIALTMLTIALHPGAPAGIVESGGVFRARVVGFLGFMIGMYALLASIGMSGWLHSRRAGFATSISAGLAALLVTWAFTGF